MAGHLSLDSEHITHSAFWLGKPVETARCGLSPSPPSAWNISKSKQLRQNTKKMVPTHGCSDRARTSQWPIRWFPNYELMGSSESERKSCSVESDSLQPHGLCSPWNLQARILECVAISFSRGSSQTRIEPRSPTLQVDSLPAESQEYWSGEPIPSPVDLPHPGLKLGSPALQANSLPTELSGK